MDSGHETLLDAISIVDDLGHRGKAVGSTGGIGDNISSSFVVGVVHANNIHGSISRRSRDDDLLGSASKMGLGLLGGGEDTGGLAHVGSADRSPRDVTGVLLGEELDGDLALSVVDDEGVGGDIGSDSSRVLSVDRIVLEEVACVVDGEEGVIDSDGHDITGVLKGGTAYETADTAESVDSKLDSHY